MSYIPSPHIGSDDDLIFDFSFDLDINEKINKLKLKFSGVDRLWRSVKKRDCCGKIDPAAFSLREKIEGGVVIWREPSLSLYEMINKNNNNFQVEADSFMGFMINEGPFDVKSDLPVLLCLNDFFSNANYSNVVVLFIDDISKTSPQKLSHTKAYHWDIHYVKQQDSLEIRSLLAHHSVAFSNNKLQLNKEKVAERKALKASSEAR